MTVALGDARALSVVTGHASIVLDPDRGDRAACAQFLREKKSKKYMGLQDELAVACAGGALAAAGLWPTAAVDPERVGLFMAVGYIPFLATDIEPVLAASLAPGADGEPAFSMERFAAEGYLRAHPLLAFRCLPNMPAYHLAANFDVQGPYYVAYPSPGQLYQALDQATSALDEGRVDVAIVGAVAHQKNFLVAHHFARIEPPVPAEQLRDAAAVLVLETAASAGQRGALARGRLLELDVAYAPFDPRAASPSNVESHRYGASPEVVQEPIELGAASPLVRLSHAPPGRFEHRLAGRDGIRARSVWAWGEPS